MITGEAARPPCPVHLRAARGPAGDISINWVRRSRRGWFWIDGSDTPLGEERESYALRLSGTGFERHAVSNVPTFLYTAQQQAADGLAGPLTIEVRQLGTAAPSRPATLTF